MRHSRLPRSGVCETEVALILESRSPSLALVMLVFLLTRTSRFGLGRPRSSPTASSVSALAAETRPRPRGAADSAGYRGGAAQSAAFCDSTAGAAPGSGGYSLFASSLSSALRSRRHM